jgi:hypothetical protein
MNDTNAVFSKVEAFMDSPAPPWFVDALFLVALPFFCYWEGRIQYRGGRRATFYSFQRLPETFIGWCCVVFLLLLIAARHCGEKLYGIINLLEFPVCIFLSFWTYARGYEVSQLQWPDPPESERTE